MLPEYFAFVSTAIVSLGTLQYLYFTIKGSVQPNRVTFFFWGLFPLIAFFAQSSTDISGVVWITLSVGVLPFLIVIASFLNPLAYWKIKKRDYLLAGIAVGTMILWYMTNDATMAVLLSLLADFLVGIPTLIKSYTAPSSEDWRPYALNAFGFLIGILAVQNWVFSEYSFVLYLCLISLVFSMVIFVKQRQLVKI